MGWHIIHLTDVAATPGRNGGGVTRELAVWPPQGEWAWRMSVAEVAATIDRVERTIRTGVPVARLIYLEPDVHRDHRAAAFVTEHEGHIDPEDPHYADITGAVADDDDDPIWT